MTERFQHARRMARGRRGIALLVCLFVVAVTSIVLLGILRTVSIQMSAISNVEEAEEAYYMAEAGVNQAIAQLETNPSWRGTVVVRSFPPGARTSYTSTAVSGSGSNVDITGVGASGRSRRVIQVTVAVTP